MLKFKQTDKTKVFKVKTELIPLKSKKTDKRNFLVLSRYFLVPCRQLFYKKYLGNPINFLSSSRQKLQFIYVILQHFYLNLKCSKNLFKCSDNDELFQDITFTYLLLLSGMSLTILKIHIISICINK